MNALWECLSKTTDLLQAIHQRGGLWNWSTKSVVKWISLWNLWHQIQDKREECMEWRTVAREATWYVLMIYQSVYINTESTHITEEIGRAILGTSGWDGLPDLSSVRSSLRDSSDTSLVFRTSWHCCFFVHERGMQHIGVSQPALHSLPSLVHPRSVWTRIHISLHDPAISTKRLVCPHPDNCDCRLHRLFYKLRDARPSNSQRFRLFFCRHVRPCANQSSVTSSKDRLRFVDPLFLGHPLFVWRTNEGTQIFREEQLCLLIPLVPA